MSVSSASDGHRLTISGETPVKRAMKRPVKRKDRLFQLTRILRDGAVHRAEDLAARLHVTQRTIYRDMETLALSGHAVTGTPGLGYRMAQAIALPPLTLTPDEFEALNLGIAVVAEARDADLGAAARTLGAKIDAALPEETGAVQPVFATYPFASAARGFSHLATLRAAIRSRQKLRLDLLGPDGGRTTATLRPLRLEYWGRVWVLTAWNETLGAFSEHRLDLIAGAVPLPEMFVDEPGKRLEDFSGT